MAEDGKQGLGDGLKKLDDERVEGIAGGYLFNANHYAMGNWRWSNPYEVIDDDGEVVARFEWSSDAEAYAKEHGYNTTWLGPEELEKLRAKATEIRGRDTF